MNLEVWRDENERVLSLIEQLHKELLKKRDLMGETEKEDSPQFIHFWGDKLVEPPRLDNWYNRVLKLPIGMKKIQTEENLIVDEFKKIITHLNARISALEENLEAVNLKLESQAKYENQLNFIEKEFLNHEEKLRELDFQNLLKPENQNLSIQRMFPIKIYLSNSKAETKVLLALKEIAEEGNFSVEAILPPVYASFFQDLWGKSKDAITHPEMIERFEKIERALELEKIEKQQAEVTLSAASAFKTLHEAMKETKEGVMYLGSIIYIKFVDVDGETRVFSMSLSQKQIIMLNNNPQILKNPGKVLDFLTEKDDKKDGPTLILKS